MAAIIYEQTFETNAVGTFPSKMTASVEGANVVQAVVASPSPVRNGSHALRLYLPYVDRHSYRCEVTPTGSGHSVDYFYEHEYWVGWSEYLKDWTNDGLYDHVSQAHISAPYSDPDPVDPEVATDCLGGRNAYDGYIKNGVYTFRVTTNAPAYYEGGGATSPTVAWSGDPVSLASNRWVDWVIHFKMSLNPTGSGTSGFYEVYRNGTLVYSIYDNKNAQSGWMTCGVAMASSKYWYFPKFGIYKPAWKNTSPQNGVTSRETYVDDIRIWEGPDGFEAVSPGGAAQLPAAPSGLSALAASSSQIDLTWTDNSTNETGFAVYRKTGAGGTYAQVGTTGPFAGSGSYSDTTGLSPGTQYYYQVRAFTGSGFSDPTAETSATTSSSSGTVLFSDTFTYADGPLPSNYWSEGDVATIQNGHLYVNAKAGTYGDSTIWLNQQFSGDLRLEYDAHVESAINNQNNINQFFLYSDPSGTPLFDSRASRADAAYNKYYNFNGYIFTYVDEPGDVDQNGNPVTTPARFRLRDVPVFDHLLQESAPPTSSAAAGVTRHIVIDKVANHMTYKVDGITMLDAIDDQFNPVHHSGLMGFRTHETELWWDNLVITQLGTTSGSPAKFAVAGGSVTASGDDGAGNVAANTVDASLATRWSGSGDGAWIEYDLGSAKTVSFVNVAWYQGNARIYTFDIEVSTDGTAWTNVLSNQQSSGQTNALESYDFADVSARYVRIVGHHSNVNDWNSITETEVWGTTAGADTTPPTVALTGPTGGPLSGSVNMTATASDNVGVVRVQFLVDGNLVGENASSPYSISWNTATATPGSHSLTARAWDAAGNNTESVAVPVTVADQSTEAKFSISGGSVTASSDDGNVPANTVDGSLSTRWSAQGDGEWIRYDLGGTKSVRYVKLAWYLGNTRIAIFDVQTSMDGAVWTNALTSKFSSGATTALETYDFADTSARYVRLVGHGNSSNLWNSITETEIWGTTPAGDSTAPTVAISYPTGGTVSSTITVTATATDNVGVTGVQFLLDDAELGQEVAASPFQVNWNTAGATPGSHTLAATARDGAGNEARSSDVTVTVADQVDPVVSMAAPLNDQTLAGTAVYVAADASDDVGVVGVQFKLDGSNLGTELATPPYAVAWDSTTASTGSHSLTAVARDAAGHSTTSGAVTVTVDQSAPAVYESELLAAASNSGDAISTFFDEDASAGYNSLLTANALGDSITYTINVPTAGTYDILASVVKSNNRGKCRLYVNGSGTAQGAEMDLYTPVPYQYQAIDLDYVALDAGANTFTFQTTGQNADSGGWKLCFDYITLTPVNVGANAVANSGFETTDSWTNFPSPATRDSSGPHSGAYAMKIGGTGSWPEVYQEIGVTAGAAYQASVWNKTWSSDGLSRGQMRLQFYQNGTALGSPTDITGSNGNTWAQLTSATLTAPAGATHLRITLRRSASLTGNYYFDDVEIVRVDTPLSNPGFETTDSWTNFPSPATHDSSGPHSGTYAVKIGTSGSWPEVYQEMNVIPGGVYQGKVWNKTWSTDGLSRGQVRLQFYQNGTALGSPIDITGTNGNTWAQLASGNLTAPSGATHLRMTLRRSASLTGNYYFDDAEIVTP